MEQVVSSRRGALQVKKQGLVRQEIWSAAIDQFLERSFEEVTIEQIAAHAGVSRRTFFRYFSSKEDVMASNVRDYGNAIAEAIVAEDNKLSGYDVAKAVLKKVLTPYLSTAQRVSQIAGKSSAARMAQFLEVPLLQERLTAAFGNRGRRSRMRPLEDRILASFTLSATGLAVELWLASPDQKIADIIDRVFTAFSETFSSERDSRPVRSPRRRNEMGASIGHAL